MKKQKLFILTIFILLLLQFTSINTLESQHSFDFLTNSIANLPLDNNKMININAVSGMENVKSNVIKNGGFEEEAYNYGPENYYYWGSIYGNANSSYKDDIYSGTYAGYISSKGTRQFYGGYSNSRSLTLIPERPYIDELIDLEFWYKTENPDIASGAYTYFRVLLIGNGNYYNMYYYLSSSYVPSNSSNYVYFDVRNVVSSWIFFERDITFDVEQAFGSYDSTWNIISIYFHSQSITEPTSETILLFDEVSISNSTGFEFLEDNGDFEDGDGYPWSNYKSSPAYAYLTPNDKTEGTKALNLTTNTLYDGAYSSLTFERTLYLTYQNQPVGYYATQPNDCVLSFDWKYSDSRIDNLFYHYTYLYLILQNSTYSARFYFILGHGQDNPVYMNYTHIDYIDRYYFASGFGVRNAWHHFFVDFYYLLQSENLTNLVPTYAGIYMQTDDDYSESRMQLLMDDFKLITYPTGDPSFEQAWGWSTSYPVPSWENNYFQQYCNLTRDAHSGNFALNITSHSNNACYVYREIFLPVQENLYTDFWWKLNYLSGDSATSSIISLKLDLNYYIFYILGSSSMISFANDTNNYYYFVENYNTTGIWNNIFRNVFRDITTAFGENKWNITRIILQSYIDSMTAKVSTLFDDMHFVQDISPPELSDLNLTPIIPQYGQKVIVEVTAVDNIEISSMLLKYKIGPGSFVEKSMTFDGVNYVAEIPAAPWNTTVSYFIVAQDIYNYTSSLGTESDPLSYIVDDLVDPLLAITGPPTDVILNGTVQFDVICLDIGSGIGSFIIKIDNETVYDNTTAPSAYDWQTMNYENDQYTISFIATDKAGNSINLDFTYTIKNTPIINFILKWWPYLTAGAGALILSVIIIAIVVKIKKR